jgi:hypothetical protein
MLLSRAISIPQFRKDISFWRNVAAWLDSSLQLLVTDFCIEFELPTEELAEAIMIHAESALLALQKEVCFVL